MRGNADMHDLVAPGSLGAVLDLLAAEPGAWTPIAGGTELMVAFSAGRLAAPKLVSLWGIPDLRTIEVTPQSVAIGAAATFLDLRRHAVIAAELPLLAKAASWIGSVANQSRATLGGNLVNGSPAADSSPALLAYDAEIEIISVRGRRRVPYSEFHTGYKRNVLLPDELALCDSPAAAFFASRAIPAQGWNAPRHGHRQSRARRNGAAREQVSFARFVSEQRAWRPSPRAFGKPKPRFSAKPSRAKQCSPRAARCSPKSSRSTTFVPRPSIGAAWP